MRDVKLNRFANRGAEGLQQFGALQILRAVALVKGDAGDSVVFLLDQFLLQKSGRFSFVFEELPVSTFADLWPGHAPEWLPIDFYFTDFRRSFMHERERSCNTDQVSCQVSVNT